MYGIIKPMRNQTSPKFLAKAERAAKALSLRKDGATYEQIAAALGFASRGSAHNAVTAALRKAVVGPAEELRELEGLRLDAVQVALWPRVLAGDLEAIGTVVRLAERRCRLFGLDLQRR